MEIGLTKISSKGQIVIPLILRKKLALKNGETLAVSTKDDFLVLKKIKNPLEGDLRTLEKIKEAWKEIEEGKFKKSTSENFLQIASKW